MKTLIRFVKAYDKNFVFMDYQMHCLDIYMRRKEILLLLWINRYWTTFETLAEIEKGCKERQLCVKDW